jgi:poly(3-hydroxybutyrate) depolymerase
MAAVLGHTYPDVYAAIGVHSGLPHLAAHDLPSALAAMRQGGTAPADGRSPTVPPRIPTIVFHGDRDATVDPCNGDAVLAQSIGSTARRTPAAGTTATVSHGSTPGGRAYTRTIHTDAAGIVVAEQWVVHDAGHAWFGGDASGSYTDPTGPDASAQMLRFFAEHARATTA